MSVLQVYVHVAGVRVCVAGVRACCRCACVLCVTRIGVCCRCTSVLQVYIRVVCYKDRCVLQAFVRVAGICAADGGNGDHGGRRSVLHFLRAARLPDVDWQLPPWGTLTSTGDGLVFRMRSPFSYWHCINVT